MAADLSGQQWPGGALVNRQRRCPRPKLWCGTRWAITWVMTAGAVLVVAYHWRDRTVGSRTIYWWLPIIVSLSLMLLRSFMRLLAQRGSPSFRGELARLVWGVVLATTAAGTAAALVFAAPPLPDLERFATGVGGTVVLATAGGWLITSLVWVRIRRTRTLRRATPPGGDA